MNAPVKPLALPPRSRKPRTRGLTSMIDFGPDTFGWTGAVGGIEPLLQACGDYIDFAKIYAMNALLLPRDVVKAAARCYREHDVVPFAGGILFEYAWQRNELDGLEALLADLEIGGLEISENYVQLTPDERARMIERFQKRGWEVILMSDPVDEWVVMNLEEVDGVALKTITVSVTGPQGTLSLTGYRGNY